MFDTVVMSVIVGGLVLDAVVTLEGLGPRLSRPLAAAGIHHFEHEAQPATFGSIPESFWWAVTSLTTVGYGDAYPVTAGGRMFTAVILLAGIAIVAAPAGLVATALRRAGEETKEDERS